MDWLSHLFTKYPEVGVYLAIGIGYLIGKLKFHGVGLGVVTGSLLGGIFLGNFFHIPVSDQAKSILFLLFLFGIGYSVGPSFFRSLKGDGWRWAVLGVFVPVVGLLAAYAVARFLRLDPGYAAGMLSGALTESFAIGTASEAIRALSVSAEQKDLWVSHIAVADAICYIFGTLGVIWCCSSLAPKLLRFDLRTESKKVEANLGIQPAKPGVQSATAVRDHGYVLFLGGIVVTLLPLIARLYFGYYVLKVNPALLVGGLAGAQTMIAGVAAAQEKSDSSVATLGYLHRSLWPHLPDHVGNHHRFPYDLGEFAFARDC